jgi:hypothetical protein
MVAMPQRLDARSFFFDPQLSVSISLALVLKVCRNRFCCHSQSVAELFPSKLCNFGHSLTIQGSFSLSASHHRRVPVPTKMAYQIGLRFYKTAERVDIGTLSQFCCWLRSRVALSNKTRRT